MTGTLPAHWGLVHFRQRKITLQTKDLWQKTKH
nr:MAG TPA: hypothetical protein [Caudoviricetes sp.]